MAKLNVPTNIGFEPLRAMELANLVQRAYEQFNFYETNPEGTWEPEKSDMLMGSTTFDADLDKPSNEGKVTYKLLATFKFKELTDTFPFTKTVPFGFIAQRTLENGNPGIFIVFRGTLTGQEWVKNFQFDQVDFLGNPDFGQVSRGFYSIYQHETNAKNTLAQTVIETLETCQPNSQIFVTGHSLGSALATLCTLHIAQKFIPNNPTFKKPILYTFASPRVGDEGFASQFKSLSLTA